MTFEQLLLAPSPRCTGANQQNVKRQLLVIVGAHQLANLTLGNIITTVIVCFTLCFLPLNEGWTVEREQCGPLVLYMGVS